MAETIGQQLKQAREAKDLTIQQVVQATHIRAHQIEAIEYDDFESMPSPIQARAFLRLYAEFLGLSLDEIIDRQRDGVEKLPSAAPDLAPTPFEEAPPTNETETEPVPVKAQNVGGKLGGLIARIRQVIPCPKVKSVPVEPAKESILVEPVGVEKEELAAPLEETPAPHPEALPSQVIFTTIGRTLRQRREGLSLTLDEIERHTHVRKHYLLALEAGEFDRLPSSVQARGMLNNFARFLDLDVDALLLTFAEGLQIQRLERQPKPDEITQKPTSKYPFKTKLPFKFKIPATIRPYLSIDIFVGVGLVLLLLLFAIWGTSRIINLRAGSTPQPTALSISNILVATQKVVMDTPSPTTTGNGSSTVPVPGETLVLTLSEAGHGPVQVVVIAQEEAWVRVTVDRKVQFEGRVIAGTAYPFDGDTQIEVLTGNGRAISILYNQNNLGPMGNFGEVVDRIYTANAILNPTATFTPTPSITPTPTVTLRPTATLRPSTTPRPSATPRISPTPNQ
jgi:cytoskeletal protein RodZ